MLVSSSTSSSVIVVVLFLLLSSVAIASSSAQRQDATFPDDFTTPNGIAQNIITVSDRTFGTLEIGSWPATVPTTAIFRRCSISIVKNTLGSVLIENGRLIFEDSIDIAVHFTQHISLVRNASLIFRNSTFKTWTTQADAMTITYLSTYSNDNNLIIRDNTYTVPAGLLQETKTFARFCATTYNVYLQQPNNEKEPMAMQTFDFSGNQFFSEDGAVSMFGIFSMVQVDVALMNISDNLVRIRGQRVLDLQATTDCKFWLFRVHSLPTLKYKNEAWHVRDFLMDRNVIDIEDKLPPKDAKRERDYDSVLIEFKGALRDNQIFSWTNNSVTAHGYLIFSASAKSERCGATNEMCPCFNHDIFVLDLNTDIVDSNNVFQNAFRFDNNFVRVINAGCGSHVLLLSTGGAGLNNAGRIIIRNNDVVATQFADHWFVTWRAYNVTGVDEVRVENNKYVANEKYNIDPAVGEVLPYFHERAEFLQAFQLVRQVKSAKGIVRDIKLFTITDNNFTLSARQQVRGVTIDSRVINLGTFIFARNRVNATSHHPVILSDTAHDAIGICFQNLLHDVGDMTFENNIIFSRCGASHYCGGINFAASAVLQIDGPTLAQYGPYRVYDRLLIRNNVLSIRKLNSTLVEMSMSAIYVALIRVGGTGTTDIYNNTMKVEMRAACPLTGCACVCLSMMRPMVDVAAWDLRDNFCNVTAAGNLAGGVLIVAVDSEGQSVDTIKTELMKSFLDPVILFEPAVIQKFRQLRIRQNEFHVTNSDVVSLVSFFVSGSVTMDLLEMINNTFEARSISPNFFQTMRKSELSLRPDQKKLLRLKAIRSVVTLNCPYGAGMVQAPEGEGTPANIAGTEFLVRTTCTASDNSTVSIRRGVFKDMHVENIHQFINADSALQQPTTTTTTTTNNNNIGDGGEDEGAPEFLFERVSVVAATTTMVDSGSGDGSMKPASQAETLLAETYKPVMHATAFLASTMAGIGTIKSGADSASALGRMVFKSVSYRADNVLCQLPTALSSSSTTTNSGSTILAGFLQMPGAASVGEIFMDDVNVSISCYSPPPSSSSSKKKNNGWISPILVAGGRRINMTSVAFRVKSNNNNNHNEKEAPPPPLVDAVAFPPPRKTSVEKKFVDSDAAPPGTDTMLVAVSVDKSSVSSTFPSSVSTSTYHRDIPGRVATLDPLQVQNLQTLDARSSNDDNSLTLHCFRWSGDGVTPLFASSPQVRASRAKIPQLFLTPCRGFVPSKTVTRTLIKSTRSPAETLSISDRSLSRSETSEGEAVDAGLSAAALQRLTDASLYSLSAANLVGFNPSALMATSKGSSIMKLARCAVRKRQRFSAMNKQVKENYTVSVMAQELEFPVLLLPSLKIGATRLGASHRAVIVVDIILLALVGWAALHVGVFNKGRWKDYRKQKANHQQHQEDLDEHSVFQFIFFDKFVLKPLVLLCPFWGAVSGSLLVARPAGGGDVVLGLIPILLTVFVSVILFRYLFSHVSKMVMPLQQQKQNQQQLKNNSKSKKKNTDSSSSTHRSFWQYSDLEDGVGGGGGGDDRRSPKRSTSQQQHRTTSAARREEDDEKKHDLSTVAGRPVHFTERSALFFPRGTHSAFHKMVQVILRSEFARLFIVGYEAFAHPFLDLAANVVRPGPGVRTNLGQIFMYYRGPLRVDKKYDAAAAAAATTKTSSAKKKPRSSSSSKRRSASSSSSNHHRHFDLNMLDETFLGQRQDGRDSTTKSRYSYDTSLRLRLCSSWIFVALTSGIIVTVLGGVGDADPAQCQSLFFVAFAFSSLIPLPLLLYLRPYLVPWRTVAVISLELCNFISGIVFVTVLLASDPADETKHGGAITFTQVLATVPGSIVGPAMLGFAVMRSGMLVLSKGKVVTVSELRARLTAELDLVEEELLPTTTTTADGSSEGGRTSVQNKKGRKKEEGGSGGSSWLF